MKLLFQTLIRNGSLRVTDHQGRVQVFGDGSPPKVAIRFTDAASERRALIAPHFYLLESFTEGKLLMEEGDFYDFLDLVGRNLGENGMGLLRRLHYELGQAFLAWEHYNPVRLAQRRVSHHYDLKAELFRLFLDEDMQYSCAYFPRPETTLEEAQTAKKRHIAAKLLLADGQKVLDIGSGWGGTALEIARLADVEVLGITLSTEQLTIARRRAAEAGLEKRVRFELMDYRTLEGQFDRIVSVGMFEHVGPLHYRDYFGKIRELLTPDGVALVHSVGQMDAGGNNPWIRRRIFPGTYVPALSQVLKPIERRRLITTDVEILRLHYAETLKAWRLRFLAHRDEAARLYDERFCRMWEAYLASCEVGFRHMSLMVFQVQLAKSRHAVPLTRDYIHEAEAGWRTIKTSPRRAAE